MNTTQAGTEVYGCNCPNDSKKIEVDDDFFRRFSAAEKISDFAEILRDLYNIKSTAGNRRELSEFLEDIKKTTSPPCESEDDDEPVTDFQQFYYTVFDIDKPDRFELKNPYAYCFFNKQSDNKHRMRVFSVPPYKCGMVLVQEGSDKIEVTK